MSTSAATSGPASRVLLVGVDGLDVTELDLGIREGWLPTLAEIAGDGHRLHLHGHQDVLVGASWMTLLTGTHPPAHQIMEAEQYDPVTGRLRQVTGDDSQEPPFWSALGPTEHVPLILSPHGGGIVQGMTGTQLAGWGQYDPWSTPTVGPLSEPPEAIAWLEERAPAPRLTPFLHQPRTDEGIFAAVEDVHESIDGFGRAARALLQRHDWQLYVTQFGQAHEWAHRLWDLGDGRGRERVRELYRHVDDEVRRLAEAVPSGTTIGAYAPYGMTSNRNIAHALPELLDRAGLSARQSSTSAAPDLRSRVLQAGRRAVRGVVPPGLRPMLADLLPRQRWQLELHYADVDWERTRAIVVPNDNSGCVRVLVRGRDPEGSVEAGPEYDRVCDEIVELLREVRDADTGERLATRVERTDALFGTEVTGSMPDVVSGWSDGPPVRAITAPGAGTVDVPAHVYRSGVHRAPGWMMLSGDGLAAGGGAPRDAALVDLAPTVLDLLDVPVEGRFHGRSHRDAIT